ncbi:TonB-dependent receptor [Pedobacter sp. L105]|uniref:SusC/RagA family TonB-linked outer membrane protein n=1 Tax=Pedobacter sp. L105 TaxID=1641871 RepID=UPI001C2022F2|nr:TonB-dependent receptor [Pedobacter sp. L105]
MKQKLLLLIPWRHQLLLVLASLILPFLAYAQVPVHGTIMDGSSMKPLAGVSVSVEGKTQATQTDANGKYQLSAPAGATLVFKMIGYMQQTKVIGNSMLINIQLLSSSQDLKEVVVVSYGTQAKKEITGSISQLNIAEVKDMPVSNVGQKLQGKFAGVQIAQNSGQPGVDLSFRIRGAASINAGNSPLIVIDGFPTESGLQTVSPDEIESITVLKDASASSLYGSRAANGVILVTTKQAKIGTQSIEFSSYTGIQTVSKRGRPDLMNAQQFAEFKKEYYEDAATYEGYTGGVPAQYQNPSQYQPGAGTNWFDVLLRDAPTQDYNLSVSSGTTNLKSVVNLNYNRQDGVMLNQWAERFTARSNNVYTVSDRLTLGANLGITYRNQNITPGLGEGRNIIQTAYLTDPTVNYKNADGTYPIGFAPPGMFSTPNYYEVLMKSVNLTKTLTLIGNAYATYQIIDGLKFKTSINVNTENANNRNFSPSTILGGTIPASSASASYNTNNFLSWLSENTLTYTKTINEKHNIEAFVGYTAQKVHYESSGIVGSQFPDDNIEYLNVAATRIGTVDASDFSLLSLIGRINYNYNGRYLLSLAMRRDGSSKFGSETKYGTFPSISGGWIISDENFMKDIKKVSLLKVRASYGKVGNNNIGNYTYLAGVSQSNYTLNNQLASGSALNGIGNQNLTWETTAGYDLGLDLGLFNNRVMFTYDYYWKKTDGLLYAIDIPVQSGFNSVTSNVGRFDFWGHEFSIQTKNTTGRVKWTSSFNISFDRNIVKKLGTNDAPIGGYQEYWDDNRTAVGHPIGMFYGYINTGVYMTQKEFDTQPHDATAMVGTARFKDVSGPNGVPDGIIDYHDRTYIGNPNPTFTYGFTNQLSYKNLDFSLVLAGTVGNDIADDSFQSTENLDGVFNVRAGVANRWRSEADPGDGVYPRTRSGTTADFRNFTSRQVFSGTYIMAKNITFGYTFKVKPNPYFKGARLYLSAQNAFTFTRYPGMNPEVGYAGLNGLNQGRDFSSFPIAKTYTIGVNVNF